MSFFTTAVTAIGAGMAVWALSICLRDMEMIIRAQMFMYGKEASNYKQEIDRQRHTVPNQRKQRPKESKDQKTSIMEMCITGYGIPLIHIFKKFLLIAAHLVNGMPKKEEVEVITG